MIGIADTRYFIIQKGSYIYTLNPNGNFGMAPQSTFIYWTGANCTGTPHLNSGSATVARPRWSRYVYFSTTANQLYTLGSPNANGETTPVSVTPNTTSGETVTQACGVGGHGTNFLYPLSAVTPATIGITATGNPLKVATPLQLP